MPGFEDMLRRKPVIDKLEKITGFKPGIPLDQIVQSIAGEMQRRPANP